MRNQPKDLEKRNGDWDLDGEWACRFRHGWIDEKQAPIYSTTINLIQTNKFGFDLVVWLLY